MTDAAKEIKVDAAVTAVLSQLDGIFLLKEEQGRALVRVQSDTTMRTAKE